MKVRIKVIMKYNEYPVELKPIVEENQYEKLIICMIKFFENNVDGLYQFLEDNDISLEIYLTFRGNYYE